MDIIIVCSKSTNEKNEVQTEYKVYEGEKLIIITTDFKYALQCFINRV